MEKAISIGFLFKTPEFKEVFVKFVLKLLRGEIAVDADGVNYDKLLNVIDSSYHADIFRKIRENMKDVTYETLNNTVSLFPRFITELIASGDRITKREKDNVVREILCSALEGDNRPVLQAFQNLGRAKVADFIKQSEERTQAKKDGAWNTFSTNCTDRQWNRQIGELIFGKRKAKNLFEAWLNMVTGTNSSEQRGDE